MRNLTSPIAHIGHPRTAETLKDYRSMSATATPVAAPSILTKGTARRRSAITAVAWMADDDLDLAEWSRAGHQLGVMDRCSPWWIGDWIRYGNAKFGERYSRAAKISGYDIQTLMNRVYVASHFEISRRRENLSWSHHDAVAALPRDQQEYWLEKAITEGLTRADLRTELRTSQRAIDTAADDNDEPGQSVKGQARSMVCPHCGGNIPIDPDAHEPREHPN
jgi:hypothetical protein